MEVDVESQAIDGRENREGETRASLELLYHVSQEFAAALDLGMVLQRVVFLAMQTVGAMSGSIIVMDDYGKPVESAIITGSKVLGHTTQRLRSTLDKGLAGWVVRHRRAALIEDTSLDERWLVRRYDEDDYSAPKSAVSAPLLVRDKVVGVMTLAHDAPGFFTYEHLSLVQAIAGQAGIAVLNARLYAESQRQARVMTALADSAAAITATLNLDQVLGQILKQISQALQVQAVAIALVDNPRGDLVFQETVGWLTKGQARLQMGRGIAGWVAQEGRAVVISDVGEDQRFDDEVTLRTGLQVTAVACAPVRSRGQVIGVLEALNPLGNTFDPDALLVLTGIGSLAGTAIRHAQLFERLQAAHMRYRDLFEDSIDPIVISTGDGIILEANRRAAAALGGSKEDLIGLSITDLHAVDLQELNQQLDSLVDDDTIMYESSLKTRGEKTVPVQTYVRKTWLEESIVLQWIFRDISEHKRVESLRSDLLSMVYHDLRSPLANIVSSLDQMTVFLSPGDDKVFSSLLDIAMRSTNRIQRLTESLLDINRLEAGQQVGHRQQLDMLLILDDAVEVVGPNLEGKRHHLEAHFPPVLPTVMGDGEMLRRVVINLLENAVKFTPSQGKITIGASHSGEAVEIWVQDTGPGIPDEDHERVFEKFIRLSWEDAPKGLGLGLTYCRLTIERHGGKIWVESKPGEGARFIFTLPVLGNG